MKAICIRQPWASLILSGIKTIETRGWKTNHRGELLIVASKKPQIDGLPCGQAIAIVKIIDCRRMTKHDEIAAGCRLFPGAWAWVLEDVCKIQQFGVKGRLGIFNVKG